MKYGLIYYRDTQNIGDDILSYASKQFLPQVDYYIDREKLDVFLPETKEYVAAILNGWYLHYVYAFPPSPYIIPFFTGTHFNRDYKIFGDYSYLDDNVTDYLKSVGKIGCRDRQTLAVMKQKGIESYFSGCMTLTLPKFENIQPDGSIVLTDVSDRLANYVTELLPGKNIIRKTHKLPQEEAGADWQIREARVEEYLKCYQRASLVITPRLHCALPSIALGTPVILIGKFDLDFHDRVIDYSEYCNCFTEADILNGKADPVICSPVENKDIRILVDEMTESCQGFISSLSDKEYDITTLPELSQYKDLFIDRTHHMRIAIHKLLDEQNALKAQFTQDIKTMKNVLNIAKQALGIK